MRHKTNRFAAPRSALRGFTLIELLTVIAIIGILAAIVIPTVRNATDSAKRTADMSGVRQILTAAKLYAANNEGHLPDPQTIPNATLNAPQPAWKWIGILAKGGMMEDPTFYFSKLDPAFSGTYPQFIIQPTAARNTMNLQFTTNRSPSWEFVGAVKENDTPTTPVVYTRGLTPAGTWNVTSGVYKDTGGFVAFLGGNVQFYSSITTANSPFRSNNPTSTSTNPPVDIRQAIPLNGTAASTSSARIYGIPPPAGGGGMIGSAAGTLAARGP